MNLKQLLGICEHKWILLHHWDMLHAPEDGGGKSGHKYILQCKKCGKIEKKRV